MKHSNTYASVSRLHMWHIRDAQLRISVCFSTANVRTIFQCEHILARPNNFKLTVYGFRQGLKVGVRIGLGLGSYLGQLGYGTG